MWILMQSFIFFVILLSLLLLWSSLTPFLCRLLFLFLGTFTVFISSFLFRSAWNFFRHTQTAFTRAPRPSGTSLLVQLRQVEMGFSKIYNCFYEILARQSHALKQRACTLAYCTAISTYLPHLLGYSRHTVCRGFTVGLSVSRSRLYFQRRARVFSRIHLLLNGVLLVIRTEVFFG